jgi:hypothetical protein
MSEMIERVEKVLRDALDLRLAHMTGREMVEDGTIIPAIACAAIEAMREPTPKVLDAGMTAAENALDSDYSSDGDGNRYDYSYLRSDAPAEIWKAMINAALSTDPKEP